MNRREFATRIGAALGCLGFGLTSKLAPRVIAGGAMTMTLPPPVEGVAYTIVAYTIVYDPAYRFRLNEGLKALSVSESACRVLVVK